MATERKKKLIRVLQILETTDKKTPINATSIVEKLENEYNVGKVDRRSIYRDIAMLQSCGYKIEQAKDKRKGWYLDKHAFEDWEIKIMMDAVQQARCVSEKEAADIREKLLKLTSNRGRSRFSHMMLPLSGNVSTNTNIGIYIELMLEAMFLHKKIEFQYTEINDKMQKVLRKDGKYYNLNLYAIYWSDNNYYLIGSHVIMKDLLITDWIEYRIFQCQMSMRWMRRKRLGLIRKCISSNIFLKASIIFQERL